MQPGHRLLSEGRYGSDMTAGVGRSGPYLCRACAATTWLGRVFTGRSGTGSGRRTTASWLLRDAFAGPGTSAREGADREVRGRTPPSHARPLYARCPAAT